MYNIQTDKTYWAGDLSGNGTFCTCLFSKSDNNIRLVVALAAEENKNCSVASSLIKIRKL